MGEQLCAQILLPWQVHCIDQFYFFIFRSDNNKITVENYGETVQNRPIPNPVRTFGEAYADYRKFLSFVKVNLRNAHGNLTVVESQHR